MVCSSMRHAHVVHVGKISLLHCASITVNVLHTFHTDNCKCVSTLVLRHIEIQLWLYFSS